MNSLKLTPSLEDYLEAIFQIISTNKVARSMEIADKLKVKRSSVTSALRSLADKGLIEYEARSYITLTDNGLKAARCVDKRHHILNDMFTNVLGLPKDKADLAACAMEHGMTSEVCRKITAFMLAFRNNASAAKELTDHIESQSERIDCNHECNYEPINIHNEVKKELFDLNTFKPGERGKIVQIKGTGPLKKRLLEMGITRGIEVDIVRVAPFNDPIQIRIRNFNLTLRREEASMLLLERL
jgi:DtxR family Mn-dependent transcriptional regulator